MRKVGNFISKQQFRQPTSMGARPELILGCVVEVNRGEENPLDVKYNTYKVYWSDGTSSILTFNEVSQYPCYGI